ncbi:MAG: hypothetical protein K5853_07645 [Lachnospiraceae bacterium]|nr:hypothetical protein [Lachnospiraceae bacterium]
MEEKEYAAICQTIRELIQNGYEVMLFHQGFGETAIFLQVLYKYKEMRRKKLFVITYVSSRTELLKASDVIDEVFEVPEELYLALCKDVPFRMECDIKDFLTMHKYDLDRSTMKKEVCEYLGISKDTPYGPYQIPVVDANWEEYFATKGLHKGKTVFLVPHALFLGKVVDDSFWVKLVSRLKKAGYTALFNLPQESVPGVPFAYFDIIPSLRLAEKCGYVIGARTGFMDLVAAFTSIPVQAIYPDDTHPSWEICKEYTWTEPVEGDYALKYMESTGLHTLFDRPGITEHVYTCDEDLLDSIMSHL